MLWGHSCGEQSLLVFGPGGESGFRLGRQGWDRVGACLPEVEGVLLSLEEGDCFLRRREVAEVVGPRQGGDHRVEVCRLKESVFSLSREGRKTRCSPRGTTSRAQIGSLPPPSFPITTVLH